MAAQSIYVRTNSTEQRKQSRGIFGRGLLTSIVGIVLAVFVLGGYFSIPENLEHLPGSNSTAPVSSASAFGVCADPEQGKLGHGMDSVGGWQVSLTGFPYQDKNNRTWTIQEAYGAGLGFVNFHGLGDPDDGMVRPGYTADEFWGSTAPPDGAVERAEGVRSFSTCIWANATIAISNVGLGAVGMLLNLVTTVSTMAFNPTIICQTPNSGGMCLDLVGILGGDGGSDSGIIGALTSSIYLPLLLLVGVLIGVWVVWNGIVKRKFLQAISGAAWSAVAIILGLVFLLNPSLLAKAPMAITNVISNCVVGAMSGTNCLSGGNNSGVSNQGEICDSNMSGIGFAEGMAVTANKLTCQIYKAFLIEPWSSASFGVGFDDLYLKGDKANARAVAAVEDAGYSVNDFCVNTKSTGSMESFEGRTVRMNNGGEICNIAMYQMYLKVNVDGANAGGPPSATNANNLDQRWVPLVTVMASDQGYWNSWSANDTSTLTKMITPGIAGLTSLFGGAVIAVTSFFALMFYFISLIMIVFAPFFLLVGAHPGQGRRVLTGWFGQLLSNILKYMASAVFLVITIALFGALLGNITNSGLVLVFVVILMIALLMYRKEIVNMFGTVDMGGQKLSNSMMERFGRKTGDLSKAAVAGAAGGVAAGGVKSLLRPDKVLAGAAGGMYTGMSKEMSRGRGFLQQANQQKQLIQRDNIKDLKDKQSMYQRSADDYGKRVGDVDREMDTVADQMTTASEGHEEAQKVAIELEAKANAHDIAQANIAGIKDPKMGMIDAEFKKWKDLLAEADNKKLRAEIALIQGDPNGRKLLQEANAIDKQASLLRRSMQESDLSNFNQNEKAYNRILTNAAKKDPSITEGMISKEDLHHATETRNTAQNNRDTYKDLSNDFESLNNRREELAMKEVLNNKRAEAIGNKHVDLNVGSRYTGSAHDRDLRQADEIAGDIVAERKNAGELRRTAPELSVPENGKPVASPSSAPKEVPYTPSSTNNNDSYNNRTPVSSPRNTSADSKPKPAEKNNTTREQDASPTRQKPEVSQNKPTQKLAPREKLTPRIDPGHKENRPKRKGIPQPRPIDEE